jgi:type VI secretion system ImpC/EvpB family protein/type VI secretion system ImpB/VipA family protein
MLAAMAGETKGFMGGSMKFGVGEELSADEKERGPLLPLRLLVVTDLVPRDPYNAGASAPEGVIRVDPASFDDLFTRLRPRLAIEVPSVLAEGRAVRIDLSPTSLKSFRPDGLLAEVPLLRALLDGRMVLERLRDGQVNPEQAQQELHRLWSGSPFVREILGLLPSTGPAAAATSPKAAPAPAPNAPSVDALLDMVDLSAPTATAPAEAPREAPAPPVQASMSKFADLIATVARAGKTSTGVRPTEAVSRVEKAIGAQIGAILQHPEVRRLEQAYRGLRFITERAQGHTGVRFDVINARPDDMADALVRAIRANASSEPPVSCAVVELTVDGSAIGFARLEAVANAAEAHNVPVLVNGSPRLLGVADLAGVEALDNKGALFAAPQQAPWRAAASKPALRWATIALNGVLARGPYDKTTSRVREAVVKELPDDEGAWVFLAPAYAVAVLVLQSFRETGWPCRVLGAKSGGIVENLPVHQLAGEHDGAEGVAVPTEVFLSTDTQRELGKSGVLALASAPNSDAAYVLSAPTAYVTPPKRTYDSATTEPEVRLERVPLGDQLFVARLVQFLRALCGKLPPTIDPAEAQELVQGALWALFEDAKPGTIELAAKGARGDEGTVVQVLVRPRRFLGVQIEEIALEMPLG